MAKKKVVETPMMVVGTRVKDFARTCADNIRCSGDFIDAVNEQVAAMVGRAVERCGENGRATLRSYDL